LSFSRELVEELSSSRSEPEWLRQARLAAWQTFEATPMPESSKDEDWRRTDISKLDLDAFAPALNGANAPELQAQALPQGVIFCSLEEAVARYPDLIREHLGSDEGKFDGLNAALWAGGAFVYVPADVSVEAPLMAVYGGAKSQGPGAGSAVFPRTVIVLERGASLVFVDHFADSRSDAPPAGSGSGEILSSASTHIVVKDGARLSYVSLQERGEQTWHFARERAVVDRDAKVDFVIAALGAGTSKSYVETILNGPGGEANLVGLVLTHGDQHIDHQTLQEHRAPHTTSNLLLKSAVKGRSRSIFAGLVRMPKEAQQSDAFQEARALLLSEQAKADAIPKLEIVASDVRCTHAGAIGPVDPEQRFYLQTRGIPEEEAERLIVTGFFEPALERIPVERVRESTRKALAHRLEAIHE
jgi:Fe-S cluster assembly protein SufD